LVESLLSGLFLVQDQIDDEITPFLKGEWKIEDLADLILPILRLATFELKFMKDIPTKVVISEYVDLSACFYDAKQVTFVNSILQNIANKNRS
jgi:N utilization substance protein B